MHSSILGVQHFIFTSLLVNAVNFAFSATLDEWRSRSIYQVLTDRYATTLGNDTQCNLSQSSYCGGTFLGILDNLDYIQTMGFTAIWISPITFQLQGNTSEGEAYHGYWQQDLYTVNDNFGSVNDLKMLSEELHGRGMYLMVDVVPNHVAWDGPGSSVDYSRFNPFNDQSYYHKYCEIDDSDNQTNAEDCWLGDSQVSLPDLDQEDPVVASMFNEWIAQLVANYSIDGLRIDSATNINPSFYPNFTKAAGVFATGEVYSGTSEYACSFQGPIDSILNYPMYFSLTEAFQDPSGSISNLVDQINSVKSDCKDTSVLGSFSENHDQPRFASYTEDLSLAKNILTHTMLADGIPIIYQGQEQHLNGNDVPYNRETIWPTDYNTSSPLYDLVRSLNQLRTQAINIASNYTTYQSYAIYSDLNTIVLRKGYSGSQIITVLTNQGTSEGNYTLPVWNTGYAPGEQITEVFGCNQTATDGSGNIAVAMSGGLPRVFYPTSLLENSTICKVQASLLTPATETSASATSTTSSASSIGVSSGGRMYHLMGYGYLTILGLFVGKWVF